MAKNNTNLKTFTFEKIMTVHNRMKKNSYNK